MGGVVSAAVPVCYVRDIDASRRFYSSFGFAEQRSGGDGDARWSYLHCAGTTVLLVSVQPPLIQVELPLLLYLYVDDLSAVVQRLRDAGCPADVVGQPDHAPGGEARTLDPDGNVVLFGQRVATPGDVPATPAAEQARFSLIRQAAEAVSRRGGAPATCQIGGPGNTACDRGAEVKLADPWGETVWACIDHADEALITARSAFIATDDGLGLGPFLRNRHAPRDAS